MSDHVKASRLSFELARRGEPDKVSVEWVTDDICQVVLYFHKTKTGCPSGAWILCEAVDRVASELDFDGCETFASFILTFNQAWSQWDSRSRIKRKRLLQR